MEDLDQTRTVGELAAGYFGSGFHCAEAVAKAVLESLGHNANAAVAHATAFGGGFGGTYCEACGALSGGLVAIGHLHGRCEPDVDWDLPAELAAKLRQAFLDRFGSTHCATLRERFGENQPDEGRRIVAGAAESLATLLAEEPTSAADPDLKEWHPSVMSPL